MDTATELRQQLIRCVQHLEPERLTGEQAATLVTEFSTIEKAAATARMFTAVRVAQTDAWRGKGHATAADWLAAEAGITVRQAAAQLGTARKAQRLPKTKERMRRGKLSPTQAGAVTDGATADPDAEDSLLDTADRGTTADLQDQAAKAKAAATDAATRERRIRAERTLRTRTDAEGAFCLWLRGPAADGTRLLSLLKPFEEHAFRHGRTDGVRDTFENRSYDAFFTLLAWLQAQAHAQPPEASGQPSDDPTPRPSASRATPSPAPRPATSPPPPAPRAPASSPPSPTSPAPSSGAPPKPARSGPRPASSPPQPTRQHPDQRPGQPPGPAGWRSPHPLPDRLPGGNNVKVIVLVDHAALLRGHTTAGETCEIAGLGPISVETARQILQDDPFLAVVVRRGRDVINVAHHGRGLNAHQRTAIEATGMRCANLACNRTIAIQIDHRHPYAADPTTALPNQDPLCPECHRKKTHHGWHLEPGTGRRRLLPEDRPGSSDAGRPPEADPGDRRELVGSGAGPQARAPRLL